MNHLNVKAYNVNSYVLQVGDATDTVKPAVEKTYHHHHHHHHNKKKSSNNIHDCLGNTDLFSLYSMLNSVKVDLLWGRNGQEEETTETNNKKNEQNSENNNTRTDVVNVTETNNLSAPQPQQQQTTNTATTDSRKGGHVRHPSTVSLSSSNSSTISDSESEVSSNENDSGIESENQKNKDRCLEVASHFRTHLLGLYKSLEQMTEAASYLTARYQSDMGGC